MRIYFFQDPRMPATYWASESVLTRHLRIGRYICCGQCSSNTNHTDNR